MNLSSRKSGIVFRIMAELSSGHGSRALHQRVGRLLMDARSAAAAPIAVSSVRAAFRTLPSLGPGTDGSPPRQAARSPPRRHVNGCVEPRIFGERDVVRMGGPIRAVVVSTQEIFFEDWR